MSRGTEEGDTNSHSFSALYADRCLNSSIDPCGCVLAGALVCFGGEWPQCHLASASPIDPGCARAGQAF